MLVAATPLFINSAAPVAQELEKSFNCVGKALLKNRMPKGFSSEIRMWLTLITPIEFDETSQLEMLSLKVPK